MVADWRIVLIKRINAVRSQLQTKDNAWCNTLHPFVQTFKEPWQERVRRGGRGIRRFEGEYIPRLPSKEFHTLGRI